jgi:hypothetical protein
MGGFHRLLASKPEPRHVRRIPPSAFADTWEAKPHEPCAIGLRSISEDETHEAQRLAAKAAWEDHPGASLTDELLLESFNDHLMTNVLARACVDERDITKPYFSPAPEARIRLALTSGGVRHLWRCYSEIQDQDSPVMEQLAAEDLEELRTLVAALTDTDVEDEARGKAWRLGKLFLEALRSTHE